MSKKLILVEGAGDKAFIRGILNKMQIPDVEIAPPLELPADAEGKKYGNGVSNVIKYISVLVISQRQKLPACWHGKTVHLHS